MKNLSRIAALPLLAAMLLLSAFAAGAQSRKSVSILGDSYSTFEGYVEPSTNEMWYYAKANPGNTDVDHVSKTWWHQFIKDNGYKLEQNNSYSGSTVCYTGYQGNDYSARSFISRMDDLGCPDILLIFGATNDSWAGSPLGEFNWEGNPADGDFRSFRPALQYMLEHVTNRYPNTEIVYLINSELSPEVTSSIEEACGRYNVPFLQLHDIDKTAGHPNTKGMKAIADQLTEFFNSRQ